MSAATGGPAFPCPENAEKWGVTKRDYFAVKVAAGDAAADGGWGSTVTDEAIAARVSLYVRIADALIAELAK